MGPADPRVTRKKSSRWIVAGILGAAVIVALMPFLLFFMLPAPQEGRALTGTWRSDYFDGHIEIALESNGTFRERLLGYEAVPEQAFAGKWSYVKGKLVLAPILVLSPNGAEGDTLLWTPFVGDLMSLHVYSTVLRGTRFSLDEPPLDFRQVK